MNYSDQDVCACDPAQTAAMLRLLLVSISFATISLVITFAAI